MSLNSELAELFHRMAAIVEIKGENVFRALAFQKVGRLLKDMTYDIRQAYDEGRLDQIEGIGAHSQRIIEEYIKTGHSTDHDELLTSIPPGLLELLQIPGLGPKTIALFWHERGITGMEDLVKAIETGKLEGLKGIGEKKIETVKQGIALRAQAAERMGIAEAWPIAEALVQRLRQIKAIKQAEIAGSLRRRKETVGDVDIVCALADERAGEKVTEQFVKFPEVQRVLGQGSTRASVVTAGGLQVDLRLVPEANYGAALLYFTGSKDHNVKIRGMAQDKGLTLNEWGLYRLDEYDRAKKKTAEAPPIAPVASRTEPEIYRKLGMSYVEPEMREDRGEVEAALHHKLPKLIEVRDLRGDLHAHTLASDGVATIEQMAEEAMRLGYEYIAITDHSKSQVIAKGLTASHLMKHVANIRRVSERMKGITILAGSEVDILADGRLDYEDEVLAELDVVIASPHVALKQDTRKATDRLLRAIENPYVHIIGHPTGRIINQREGLPLDFAPLFKAAAANGTAMEINAGYPRLDLNDSQAHAAIEAGVLLSINTDAHSPDHYSMIRFGIDVARRAWAQPRDVINCLALADLRKFLKRKRP